MPQRTGLSSYLLWINCHYLKMILFTRCPSKCRIYPPGALLDREETCKAEIRRGHAGIFECIYHRLLIASCKKTSESHRRELSVPVYPLWIGICDEKSYIILILTPDCWCLWRTHLWLTKELRSWNVILMILLAPSKSGKINRVVFRPLLEIVNDLTTLG